MLFMGCREIDSFHLGREWLEMSHPLLMFCKRIGDSTIQECFNFSRIS